MSLRRLVGEKEDVINDKFEYFNRNGENLSEF